MIQFFSPSAEIFLSGMNRISAQEQLAQTQLTTGLKINVASDDPGDIAELMQVNSSIAQNNQISTNLTRVKTETDTAESTLSNAVLLLQDVSTLAAEAQPSTQTADTRAQIAGQVGSDLQELVAAADTSVEGRYVFSGDLDQTNPYTVDLTQTNPVSAYLGSASTRQIRLPDGSMFSPSITAQQIFDSADPTTNIFNVVSSLRAALLKNDQSGIETAITNLQSASTYLNTQLAFYGTAQDRVNGAVDFSANLNTQLLTEQSGIQDADMTSAITNLNQVSLDQQAALEAEKEIPQTSLFNYLG